MLPEVEASGMPLPMTAEAVTAVTLGAPVMTMNHHHQAEAAAGQQQHMDTAPMDVQQEAPRVVGDVTMPNHAEIPVA